jgi:hypothetical protein
MPGSLTNGFPTAPTDDLAEIRRRTEKNAAQKLEILSAVCGVLDCTDEVREMINPDGTLAIDTRSIPDLILGHSGPQRLSSNELYLAFVFRYADQPMQLFVNSPADPHKVYTISPASNEFPVITPAAWDDSAWSTVAAVFGGKYISDNGAISAVRAEIKKNYNQGLGFRQAMITETLIKEVGGPTSPCQSRKSCLHITTGSIARTSQNGYHLLSNQARRSGPMCRRYWWPNSLHAYRQVDSRYGPCAPTET